MSNSQSELDNILPVLVGYSRSARPLMGMGAQLQAEERKRSARVYHLLQEGATYSRTLPVRANISKPRKAPKKYTSEAAIKWFAEQFPKEAKPLLDRLEERDLEAREMHYGLKKRQELDPQIYIEAISSTLHISEGAAANIYYSALVPYHARKLEERLIVRVQKK